jgi:osmotically-inducible protein OsmY
MGVSREPESNQECIMSKTDLQLKQDILEELQLDPQVNAAQIGVSVNEGAVTLLGAVDTYAEKWAAEDATKRVSGVRTVAQDLTVTIRADHIHSDSDIAAAMQNALDWNVYIPKTVTAKVESGSVTLEGQVIWNYQRVVAERAARCLTGVVAVHNSITLKPQTSATQVKEKVLAALHRQAVADGKSIHIETSGGKVTLTGHASSWQSIEDAANAAWAVPGVTEVIDQVMISMTL